MLLLLILFALLLSAKSKNPLDVSYSFDTDFYDHFDNKKCNGTSEWRIVKYDALNIASPYSDSGKGIQALRQSCASSFPIDFFGGTLEITVFIRASSRISGISIEVFDEDDTSISCVVYGRSSKGFGRGWRRLFLQITNATKGYIQLRGRSLKYETVVIDSFRYKPNITKTRNLKKVKRSVNYEAETGNIYEKNRTNDHEEKTINGSIEEIGEISAREKKFEGFTEEDKEISVVSDLNGTLENRTGPPTELNKEQQQKNISFWIPIVYFLATLAITALIASVSAYYCGKVRAPDPSPILIENLEPARTIIIPRVTGTIIQDNNSRFTTIS